MDKTLLTLVVCQALNSARDVPNDVRALGKLGQALDLAVAKLIHVWSWALGSDVVPLNAQDGGTFQVYAGQARQCVANLYTKGDVPAEIGERADLILATAIDEFNQRTTVVYCRILGRLLSDRDARAALCLGFNVLTDLDQAKPPLHAQLHDAVTRLTPIVKGVIDA